MWGTDIWLAKLEIARCRMLTLYRLLHTLGDTKFGMPHVHALSTPVCPPLGCFLAILSNMQEMSIVIHIFHKVKKCVVEHTQ